MRYADARREGSAALDWFVSIFIAASWAAVIALSGALRSASESLAPPAQGLWRSGADKALDLLMEFSSHLAELPGMGVVGP